LNVELPFLFKELDDLPELWRFCERPDAEFMDVDLEARRRALVEAAKNFHHVMGLNTFPRRDSNENELPREWMFEQPQRYAKVVQEMLVSRRVLTESFDTFVQIGRRKLGINYQVT
jgi:hypothetical protein